MISEGPRRSPLAGDALGRESGIGNRKSITKSIARERAPTNVNNSDVHPNINY